MDPKQVAIIIIFVTACIFGTVMAIVRGPLGKALGRRLEGSDDLLRDSELQARLGEVDELRARLAEVEERLDFQERLLAQGGLLALPRREEEA